jgi:hypothetical protein
MRSEIPPPGPAMTFDAWSRAIVAGVRRYLPDARAVRKGPRLVIIRHGDREAHLKQDDGPAWSFWITFPSATMATTMASLVDDRRDAFTVKNLSQSVAGYFDARFTRAESAPVP